MPSVTVGAKTLQKLKRQIDTLEEVKRLPDEAVLMEWNPGGV